MSFFTSIWTALLKIVLLVTAMIVFYFLVRYAAGPTGKQWRVVIDMARSIFAGMIAGVIVTSLSSGIDPFIFLPMSLIFFGIMLVILTRLFPIQELDSKYLISLRKSSKRKKYFNFLRKSGDKF